MDSNSLSSPHSIEDLADGLRSLGMVVVPREGGLEVRLSTFETIRVRLTEAGLECEPRFGAVSRTRARWSFQILSAAMVPWLFLTGGLTPVSVSVAFLLVLAAVSQAIRYNVTESVISRIQMVWMGLKRFPSASIRRDDPKSELRGAQADIRALDRGGSPNPENQSTRVPRSDANVRE